MSKLINYLPSVWGLIDQVYPVNPFTHQRELPHDPLSLQPALKRVPQKEWPDKNVRYHIGRSKESSRHYRSSLGSLPSPTTFQDLTKKVFNQITEYANQTAYHAGDHRYLLDYQLKIIESEKLNAYALYYSGEVQITSGLLKQLDCFKGPEEYADLSLEDKIAATLAHEVAHHCLGHSYRHVFSPASLILGTGIFASWFIPFLFSSATPLIVCGLGMAFLAFCQATQLDLYFNRKKESDADHLAIEFLYQTGYDIRAAKFRRLVSASKPQKSGSYWKAFEQKRAELSSTHPTNHERLLAAKKTVAAYYEKYGHYRKP